MTAMRHQHSQNVSELRTVSSSLDLADAVVGTAWGVARLSVRLAARGARLTAPVLGVLLRPPLVPPRLHPAYGAQVMAERWQRDRPEVLSRLRRWSSTALPGAVDFALDQLDLTQLVLERVDLKQVVSGALEELDLTAIVVEQVDLGDVVAAALQRVDLTSIVMSQVDLLGVAQYVVDGIDLPEIIRESTGSVASEAVVGLRMQGIDADVVVGRVVDRMLRRRRELRTEEVPEPHSASDSSADPAAGKPG